MLEGLRGSQLCPPPQRGAVLPAVCVYSEGAACISEHGSEVTPTHTFAVLQLRHLKTLRVFTILPADDTVRHRNRDEGPLR